MKKFTSSRTTKTRKNSRILAILGLIISFIILLVASELLGFTNLTPLSGQTETKRAETTSKEPTAQSSYSAGSPKDEPTRTLKNEGTVSDNDGKIVNTPPAADWTKSKDGTSLVVYSPAKNSLIKEGSYLDGASTADKVNFRLIDEISGVIARGTINVVNGKFSGTFHFSTESKSGQVDIFTADADGVESNNVSIPVRFR